MSFGEFRDANLRVLFDAVALKNLQLQQAIRSGNDQLVQLLDREIDPLISELVAYRASEMEDIYLQMRLLTKLLREDADDRSCVLRHAAMLSLLVERYFGPKKSETAPVVTIEDPRKPTGTGDDEQLNEAILNNLPERVAVVTRDYRYLFANVAMAGMLGARQMELIGRSVFDVGLTAQSVDDTRDALDLAFAGRSGSFTAVFSEANSSLVTLRGRFGPLRASNGMINGAILTLCDAEVRVGDLAA